jgi:hypothetical protein
MGLTSTRSASSRGGLWTFIDKVCLWQIVKCHWIQATHSYILSSHLVCLDELVPKKSKEEEYAFVDF